MHIAPASSKFKLENQRITRAHIKAYLEKRYDPRKVDIILQTLKFPATNTYEEHWKHLDKFIGGDIKQKKKLGFLLHDINGDGRICPNDVFELSIQVNQTSYLLSNDVYQLIYNLKRKLIVEVKPPGYLLNRLNEELNRKWLERNNMH